MNEIAPSVLSADFSKLAAEIEPIEKAGIKFLHIDVMDGHFVPNITFGPSVVKAIRKHSDMVFDVHLMISHPLQYVDEFAKAGANYIVFHTECDDNIAQTLAQIKKLGVKCGLSIKPKTSPEVLKPFIKDLDMVLVMTVEPGFGGQKMISECLDKLEIIRKYAQEQGVSPLLEVDGGITAENVACAAAKGAQVIVAGSSVFSKESPAQAALELSRLANS